MPCLPASFCRAFVTDHYVRALPPEVRGHLVMLHMLRATGDLEEMPDRVLAHALGCNAETFGNVTRVLEANKLVFRRDEGQWELKDARKRRYGHGDSTARVRAWRQRKREEQVGGCNAGNAALHRASHENDVTLESFTLPVASRGALSIALHDSRVATEQAGQSSEQEEKGLRADLEGGSDAPIVTQNTSVTEVLPESNVYVYVRRNRKENVYVNETADEGKLRSPVTPIPGAERAEYQRCFGEPTSDLPAPRILPEKSKRQKEFSELQAELPPEALEQKRDAQEYLKEIRNLHKIYLKRGYDFVYWNIRYVAGQAAVNNFWSYLMDCIKHNRGELEKERAGACEASRSDLEETSGGGGELLQEENRPAREHNLEATRLKGKAEISKLTPDHKEVLRKSAIGRFPKDFQEVCSSGEELPYQAEMAIEAIMVDLIIQIRISKNWQVRDPVAEWGPLIKNWSGGNGGKLAASGTRPSGKGE